MVRPSKRQIEKLKKQDKDLAKLPSMEKEKKVFSKGESFLKRLLRPKKVRLKRETVIHPKEFREKVKKKKKVKR